MRRAISSLLTALIAACAQPRPAPRAPRNEERPAQAALESPPPAEEPREEPQPPAPPPEETSDETPPPMIAALMNAEDPAEAFPRRAWLARFGPARVRRDGPASDPREYSGCPRLPIWATVAEDAPGDVRIVESTGGLTLLLWLSAAMFEQVPSERVAVRAAPNGRAPRGSGVWVYPGLLLTLGRTSGTAVEVSGPDDIGGVRFSGWLPRSSLAPVYTPATAREPLPNGQPAHVRNQTDVLDRPGGRAIAQLAWVGNSNRSGTLEVRVTGQARDGFVPVAFPVFESPDDDFLLHGAVDVRGWVAVDALGEAEGAGYGRGEGCMYGSPSRPHSIGRLPARALLRDAPGGEVVGFAPRTFDAYVEPEPSGGFWVLVWTHWGEIRAWTPVARDVRPRR